MTQFRIFLYEIKTKNTDYTSHFNKLCIFFSREERERKREEKEEERRRKQEEAEAAQRSKAASAANSARLASALAACEAENMYNSMVVEGGDGEINVDDLQGKII